MKDSSMESFDLQIIIASGTKNVEKVITGLAIALSCSSSGAKVVVFFTMEGAAFANPDEGNLQYVNGFESIEKYIELLHDDNVRIEVCTTCVENYCLSQKIRNKKIIRSCMHLVGLSTAAIRALKVQTLIF
jgi:predicted peroxiredoxin